MRERLEAIGVDKPLVYMVFTTPFWLRTAAADPKVWRKWRSKLWKILRVRYGARAGYVRTDPAGEDGENWHPHLNFLFIQRDGFRAFVDVEQLRAVWREVLGVKADASVDVWTQYAGPERPWQRQHWYDYMSRTWPDWQKAVEHGCIKRTISLGRLPARKHREKCCCKKCGERYRSLKFGSVEERDRYAAYPVKWLDSEVELREMKQFQQTHRNLGWGYSTYKN